MVVDLTVARTDRIVPYTGDRKCMHTHETYVRAGNSLDGYETGIDTVGCDERADVEITSDTSTNGGRSYRNRRWWCERHVPRRLRPKVRELLSTFVRDILDPS